MSLTFSERIEALEEAVAELKKLCRAIPDLEQRMEDLDANVVALVQDMDDGSRSSPTEELESEDYTVAGESFV